MLWTRHNRPAHRRARLLDFVARASYCLILYLVTPVYIAIVGLRDRRFWQQLHERFGFVRRAPRSGIWLHAASVGEVHIAATLVRALRERSPQHALCITTITPTGYARARALFPSGDVRISYLPLDLPGAVRRFLARTQPRLAVILETELWPNLYLECGRQGVPLVVANARLSPRSVKWYRKLHRIIAQALSHVQLFATQSQLDADRFCAIGAPPDRVRVSGNIKFDFALSPQVIARGRQLRELHAPTRPVWIAGSTHEGEEIAALEAHRTVQLHHAQALLILAPRHPQRIPSVTAMLAAEGCSYVRHSQGEVCTPHTTVLLVDTLGELMDFYAAADVAFVGGSLVPAGGHNLLEPAVLGIPVLTGPFNSSSPDVARALIERGGASVTRNGLELGVKVAALLAAATEREALGALARSVVDENRGALDQLITLLGPMLS